MSEPRGLPNASLTENLRFNTLIVVPNAIQGIFRRRPRAVAAANRAGVDGHAIELLAGMSRSYDGGPVWVRVATERALLLLDPADSERALEGSPEPFASDPKAKRDGMVTFQPEALTISRGEQWRRRREFAERVLDAGAPERLGDRIAAVCAEEVERLLGGPVAISGGTIGWEPFHRALQRIARRVILGDGAAEDAELSAELEEMMAEANGMPGEPSERLRGFLERLEFHLSRAEPGSLAAHLPRGPAAEGIEPAGQMIHWLFAFGDTLAINALRALAVLAADPVQAKRAQQEGAERLEACLCEAMRLWPTTPMLSRVSVAETEWEGESVPAGSQVVIVNTYAHRDPERIAYADRFAPEEWIDGEAAQEPAFNHFSRGPQGCPGAEIALFAGRNVLAELLAGGPLRLRSPDLEPAEPMPKMLDHFAIEVEVEVAR